MDGNELTVNRQTASYDFENYLVSLASIANGTVLASYVYDADGNRCSTYVSSNTPTTTSYVVDTSLPYASVVEEYSGTNIVPSARYDYGDDLVRMDRSGVYYYLYDGLGSTRQLVNTAGAVTDSYGYSAFGEMASHTGTAVNPFLFNAQQFDGASGDYYLRARYYDQSNGRFISQDPYGGSDDDPVSLHRYLYTSGDPAGRVDPGGEEDTLFGLSVGLAVQQTIAAAFVGGAVFAVGTSAQGGSPLQVIQSTVYGAEAGFALAFAATKGRGLTTLVSSFFGGFASAFLKAALQDTLHPGEPVSSLDVTFAFQRGFASSALSSALSGDGENLFGMGGAALYKAGLAFNITFFDDIANSLRKEYDGDSKHAPGDFSDLPNQIKYAALDGLISGGTSAAKQALVDYITSDANIPASTTQFFSGLSDKDFTKIYVDVLQKINSTGLKGFLKPAGHAYDPNID